VLKMKRHVAQTQRGMTLVELMVVIAIIIILAALLIPRFMDVTNRAKKAQCNGNIATMNSAASVYIAEHLEPATDLQSLINEGYIDAIPDCPFSVEYVFDGFCISNWQEHLHVN